MSTFSFAKHARKKLGSQLTLDTINGVTEIEPAGSGRGQVIMGQLSLGKGCRPDGSFTLGYLLATDGATKLPFVGSDLGRLRDGALVRLRGRWAQNSEYGWQFQADSVESRLPTTPEGIRRYIEANIQRCGPTRADKLIDILGEQALTVLLQAPDRAETILGGKVGQQVAESFATWADTVRSDAEQSHFEARLYSAGMTRRMANRVFRHFQTRDETERVILTQPYRLIQVPGIGFRKADALARAMGVSMGDPSRVAAGVVHALEQAKGLGHSALPPTTLIRDARQALELTSDDPVADAVQRGLTEGTLLEEQGLLFLPKTRDIERQAARVVRQLLQFPRPLSPVQRSRCDAIIADTELAPTQQRAVWMGLEHGCSILTGRPGAGKTTTTKVFVTCAQALDLKVLLAAPTGKAAARAAEVTGIPAQTIHMMIGGFPGSIRKEPLDADVVIVEGLHALHALPRAHVDIAVFVEASRDLRWARAVKRERATPWPAR
jgi:exodeoxyribonuclease V alpha subunit